MNEHLKPVIEIVLPEVISADIEYWVYGGVAYAAMVGKFYRSNSNPDLDIFVLDKDFTKLEKILQEICIKNNWKLCKKFENGRNKLELFILKNGKKWIERLSVIPTSKINNHVELKFRKGPGEYPKDILSRVERNLDGYKFFTISDHYLKRLFIEYLDSKKSYPNKRLEDARYILSAEEFRKYFPNESYKKN